VTESTTYLTVAEAALWLGKGERTVRRWMNARLVTVYKRGDGILVLDITELGRVEREQRHRNPVRHAKRTQMFAQVGSMTYSRQ